MVTMTDGGDGPALFLLATPDGIVTESVDAKAGTKKNDESCDITLRKTRLVAESIPFYSMRDMFLLESLSAAKKRCEC